ncbi:MAG: DUF2970 domain-containing protein [Proteobacteria bacterium]|jgi:hypothetical protein|nr:DUF2970 domain-containing protein [Pseudomonadota bacterium]MDA1134377.1 DUF2970 domain-containing protein [Pseudomonadota bacterium]
MKVFGILRSIISAFFGVQSNAKLLKDDEFVEKYGIKYFLIFGFFLVIVFLVTLYTIVHFILGSN